MPGFRHFFKDEQIDSIVQFLKTLPKPEEVKLLMQIKELLYSRRFTIAGARRRLLDVRREKETPQAELGFVDADRKMVLNEIRTELKQLLTKLRGREAGGRLARS